MDSERCDVSRKLRRSSKRRLWPSVPRRKTGKNKKDNKRPSRAMQLQAKLSAHVSTNDAADNIQGAATSSAAEVSCTGVQLVKLAPATELETEGPDVVEQQPAPNIAAVVAVPEPQPEPLPKLRKRRPPPMTPMSTRSNIRVAAGDKERLAELVRGHPVLYNTHYAHFKDKAQTRYAWLDISRRMLRPDTECIAMWRLLKYGYTQALRARKQKAEQGLDVKSPKYDKFMSFVKPFLNLICKPPAPKPWAVTHKAPSEGSEPAPEWGGDVSCGAAGRSAASPAQPQRNTIVELFRNLGETVKDFPKEVKIRVKSEVLKVVSDAREFILSNNTVEQLFVVEDIVVKEEPSEVQ